MASPLTPFGEEIRQRIVKAFGVEGDGVILAQFKYAPQYTFYLTNGGKIVATRTFTEQEVRDVGDKTVPQEASGDRSGQAEQREPDASS